MLERSIKPWLFHSTSVSPARAPKMPSSWNRADDPVPSKLD